MGQLIKGKWVDQWYDTAKTKGEFQREDSKIRHHISTSPVGDKTFLPESGRYHLYVSLACPWAHRTLIFRKLKGLEPHITVSIVKPEMLENGWAFTEKGDSLNHFKYLYQVYTAHDPTYSGRVTVPILWDKKTKSIVNNESSDIIRLFNSAFNQLTNNHDDYYPTALQTKIDSINDQIYHAVNNGVYKCGFATTQSAYENAFVTLFETLDQLETRLSENRYLLGKTITEADWRLFTTLIRFDEVYYGHFKCNQRQIEDYPALADYRRALYQWPGIAETVDFYHIKRHYYYSHKTINPTQIVPLGPDIDYSHPLSSR